MIFPLHIGHLVHSLCVFESQPRLRLPLLIFGCIQVESDQRAQDCLLPMGITSENVAERYGIGRKQQDAAAVCHSTLFWCYCSAFLVELISSFILFFNAGAAVDVVKYVFVQVKSHQKAAAARASGRFNDEIIPVHTKVCSCISF